MNQITKAALFLPLVAAFIIAPTNACVSDSSLYVGGLLAANLSYVYGLTPNVITTQPTRNDWIPIPSWLGGTWRGKSETILSSYDYRQQRQIVDAPVEIQVNRICTLGSQQDNSGRIWHFIGTPYKRIIETPECCDYQQTERLELVSCRPVEVVVNSIATITRIDKKTGNVSKVFREQTLTTYAPLSENKILVNFDISDFDMQGRRLFASTCVCTETRVQPMTIVDQDDRGDLRSMFREFLKAHALSTLLPSR